MALKPAITVYSGGSNSKTKRFDSIIAAAFWAGVDYAEQDINSIKIRQPVISNESDLAELIEFAALMVQRQIAFSVEFPTESQQAEGPAPETEEKSQSPLVGSNGRVGALKKDKP